MGTPDNDASSRSPISAIFTGQLKSTVRFQQPHAHYKPSATIEAFNMLHLDIAADAVVSLEEALRQHSVSESIGAFFALDRTETSGAIVFLM